MSKLHMLVLYACRWLEGGNASVHSAFLCFTCVLHGLTSGLWSVTEPSPDAPGPRGQGMSICYNRALAAELVSSSLNCVKIRYRGSNPRPLARYCSHKAVVLAGSQQDQEGCGHCLPAQTAARMVSTPAGAHPGWYLLALLGLLASPLFTLFLPPSASLSASCAHCCLCRCPAVLALPPCLVGRSFELLCPMAGCCWPRVAAPARFLLV